MNKDLVEKLSSIPLIRSKVNLDLHKRGHLQNQRNANPMRKNSI